LQPDERLEASGLNLEAGIAAMATLAFDAAYGYFSSGLSLLPDDAWDAHYDLAFELRRRCAEAASRARRTPDFDGHVEVALEHARPGADRLRVLTLMAIHLAQIGEHQRCIEIGRQGLAEVGLLELNIDPDGVTQAFTDEVEHVCVLIGDEEAYRRFV